MQVILWLLRSAVEAVIKLMAEKALELVIRQLDGREGTGACHQATHKGYKACPS